MKKHVTPWLLAACVLLLLFTVTACGNQLAAPQELAIDEDNVLSWGIVDYARSYTIEIRNVDGSEPVTETTFKAEYSLSSLAVGDYEIRVMASGGQDNDRVSPWSQTLAFHRDYESGCVYELYNGNSEYRILRAGVASGVVLIEGTYRGKPVTAIADNAFKGNRFIEQVVLEANIRTIGENAFYNCSQLTSVSLPDTVTSLGDSAFQGCRLLTTVNIPKGVTVIPNYCFTYCRALQSLALGEQIESIGESAFAGTALTSVRVPDATKSIGASAFSSMNELENLYVGSGVTTIGSSAFVDDPKLETVTFAAGSRVNSLGSRCFANDVLLAEIVLPNGLTDIGDNCFYGCTALAAITIPDTVARVGARAFNVTGIYANAPTDFVYADRWLVAVKDLNKYKSIGTDPAKSDVQILDNTVGIADYCFYKAELLESVTLPASVKTVGGYAFRACPKLQQFVGGSSLTSIMEFAFMSCETLYKLNLTKSTRLELIAPYAFYKCTMLDNNVQTPIIPASVTRIGTYAFKDTRLWTKPDESGIIYAGDWVVGYQEDANIGEVTLSESVIGIADYTFYQCKTLITVGNLSRCKYIGAGAFYDCTKLMSVALNPRLTTLPDFVFYNCSELLQIEFPGWLESIGHYAFYKCTSLYELDFSSTYGDFTSIGSFAFYGCEGIGSIEFTDSLSEIGSFAFYRCKALEALTIPDAVQEILPFTFTFCIGLKTISFGAGLESIGSYAFYKCEALTAIHLSDAVQTVDDYAFYKCTSVRTLELGGALRTIGNYAFYNLSNVTTLRLPDTLTRIGSFAFKGAKAINSLIIPASVCEIRENAFYGCYRVTFYVEAGADMESWNLRWNSSSRPVVSNVTLAETGDHVLSVTIRNGSVKNDKSLTNTIFPIADPIHTAYTFAGWAKEDGIVIATEELSLQEEGTILTAVWTAAP